MNIKTNSIRVKTFIYLLSYSAIILLLLWLFQIVFLKIFYERYQYNKIVSYAATINEDNLKNLEQDVYKQDLCAEVHYYNEVYHYNSLNKDCILLSNNAKIENAKNKLLNNGDKKTIIKVIDPRYDSKSILYGVKLNDHTRIILNTKLEDVNSTTHILSGQLIYITLIVIILSGIMSILVSNMLNKPILKITKKAKEMAKGNYEPDEEIYNIQELDELTTTLNYAKSEIKNTDELRKDLMANVSHDLKTPLTMIKAYAEMARDINADNKEKRNENLSVILEETDRLNILVNDILNLSKLENNKDSLTLEDYDLVEEVKSILKRYEIIKETENYKLILTAPEIAVVNADKNKINQVLYNLINNAINYTGKDLTVKINIIENKNNYLVEVKDTGKGIDKKELSLIWTKYYKNEKNHQRNVVGTGLGLSIVQNILSKHKFKYGVESVKNKGTKFYFYINKSKKIK